MNTPDPTGPNRPQSSPTGLPPAPWILLDRGSAEQLVSVLDRLEQWLAGADPTATRDCATGLSHGEDDEVAVATWAGALGARLSDRIQEADTWS